MSQALRVPPAKIAFSEEDIATINEHIARALRTGNLTLGPVAQEFEQAFAALCQVEHAVAVNSGTSALEIALRSIDVTGREVVVPANTFFATAAAVVHAGGRVRFADVDRQTLALDPRDLEQRINASTKAVILVHIGGSVSPHTPEIVRICEARGIPCIEDAAHAAGASLNGRPAGSFGAAATFSFYPTKIITSGEGGMLVTHDDRIASEARIYRDQGKAGFTQNLHSRLGYNWRMSEPHAAIGLVHLRRLREFIQERRAIAKRYDEALSRSPVRPVALSERSESNYYKYIAWLPDGVDRAALKHELRTDHGIGLAGEVYERPLHLQPVFEGIAPLHSLPVAEEVCARHICLPIYQGMSAAEVTAVVSALDAAQALGSAQRTRSQ